MIVLSTDALDHPHVATIVGGYAGDDRRRVRHSLMVHVFLRDPGGVVLRSRFWLGAAIRPHPRILATPGAWALNNRLVRRLPVPSGLPRGVGPPLRRGNTRTWTPCFRRSTAATGPRPRSRLAGVEPGEVAEWLKALAC